MSHTVKDGSDGQPEYRKVLHGISHHIYNVHHFLPGVKNKKGGPATPHGDAAGHHAAGSHNAGPAVSPILEGYVIVADLWRFSHRRHVLSALPPRCVQKLKVLDVHNVL